MKTIKKCGKCGEILPATPEFFHRCTRFKDGLQRWCKRCKCDYGRQQKIKREQKVLEPDLPGEQWRPVLNYEGWYEASNKGRIKRIKESRGTFAGKILTPQKSRNGYLFLGLSRNGKTKRYHVHRLTAGAFLGPCPEGLEVNHKDGDKTNNAICNLEYITHKGNIKHAHKSGLVDIRGEKSRNHILTEKDIHQIRRLLIEGKLTQQEIGNMYKISYSTISDIKLGKTWGWLKDKADV